jgi:hypothetical protein
MGVVANTTILIGAVLIALGLVGWFGSGGASVTALIPAFFGVVLLLLGVVARKEQYRKHAMHAAVIVGLLGFLGSARGLVQLPALIAGAEVARPAAVIAQSIMAVLTGIFVALCVKSFIDARRNRAAA